MCLVGAEKNWDKSKPRKRRVAHVRVERVFSGGVEVQTSLILYCRAGFEGECAAEIQQRAAELGASGYCRAQAGSAFVAFVALEPGCASSLAQQISFKDLIFARQMFAARRLDPLPTEDRVTPILAALDGRQVSQLLVETADTNEAKELLGFARKFEKAFAAALRRYGLLLQERADLPRLHLFLLDGSNAYLGFSNRENSSPWFMGIPRLRFPRGAPSRSALKLEEAFHVFLGNDRERHLKPGTRAVDLGAAPGGWTRLLVNYHLRVIAVDNGPMDADLLESGVVEHRREDGFRFRPSKAVDWLVCDMVEQPIRVAQLIADWMSAGLCREAIFNLKLPMKKRYQEVQRCADLMHAQLSAVPHQLRFKQLYHDREEVTGYLVATKSSLSSSHSQQTRHVLEARRARRL